MLLTLRGPEGTIKRPRPEIRLTTSTEDAAAPDSLQDTDHPSIPTIGRHDGTTCKGNGEHLSKVIPIHQEGWSEAVFLLF
jgi:hypothetical protein